MVSIRSSAIIPASLKDPKGLTADIKKRQRRLGDQVRRDFQKTVRTWKKKPKFKVSFRQVAGSFVLVASTDNQIYIWVNDGTKPHEILPVNAPRLIFGVPYKAKTTPGLLGSRPGGLAANASIVSSLGVQHPGTEARDFDTLIADRFRAKFVEEMNAALRTYLRQKTRPALPPGGRR